MCFPLLYRRSQSYKRQRKKGGTEKNEKDDDCKKEVRKKKSHFNQPCTDFIDCVVVKAFEKVIRYVGALLFFLCNCFVQGIRFEFGVGHLHHTGTKKASTRR